MKISLKNFFKLKNIIISISLILLVRSSFYLFVYTMSQVMHRHDEMLEPGSQFADFKKYLKGQKSIGFLTDKDMSPENNDGFFSQTQYILAPIVVNLNNPKNEFNILDYSEMNYIIYSIRALNSVRLTSNEYGQALIRRRSP